MFDISEVKVKNHKTTESTWKVYIPLNTVLKLPLFTQLNCKLLKQNLGEKYIILKMCVRQVVNNSRNSLAYASKASEKRCIPTKNYACQVCSTAAVQLCRQLCHKIFLENAFQNEREGDVTTKFKVGCHARHLSSRF